MGAECRGLRAANVEAWHGDMPPEQSRASAIAADLFLKNLSFGKGWETDITFEEPAWGKNTIDVPESI